MARGTREEGMEQRECDHVRPPKFASTNPLTHISLRNGTENRNDRKSSSEFIDARANRALGNRNQVLERHLSHRFCCILRLPAASSTLLGDDTLSLTRLLLLTCLYNS